MKRIIILSFLSLLILCGCGKINEKNIVKEFSNKVAKSKSYTIIGEMQIFSNEEKYDYDLAVNYLKNNYYKVSLVNQTNNHEQIIVRNDDGVYVITPSLNKSFKFQSEWPDNSSQAYILKSLVNDLKSDKDLKYEKDSNGYIVKCMVNYPNNSALKYQKVYFDKNATPTKIEVYNKDDEPVIVVAIDKIDYKANLEKEDFNIDDMIKNNCCSDNEDCDPSKCEDNKKESNTKTTSIIDNIIYPLYVPEKSSLTTSEKIDTDNGNRVILTFAGEKDFILVEEASKTYDDLEIIPVYGDPQIVSGTIAALGANSLYWTDNNIDFYLASETLSGEEMLTIASSMSTSQIVSMSK